MATLLLRERLGRQDSGVQFGGALYVYVLQWFSWAALPALRQSRVDRGSGSGDSPKPGAFARGTLAPILAYGE